MKKIKWYLQNFMSGRNGADDLSKASVHCACVFSLISAVLRSNLFYMLSCVMLFYGMFRMFSRDLSARSRENLVFLNYLQAAKMNFEQRKTHRIFVCKRCGRKIRVPKGKGKIEITCPVCKNKMIHRT